MNLLKIEMNHLQDYTIQTSVCIELDPLTSTDSVSLLKSSVVPYKDNRFL